MKRLSQAMVIAIMTLTIAVMSAGISEAGPGNGFRPSRATPQEPVMRHGYNIFTSEPVHSMAQAQRLKDCIKLQAGNSKSWVHWDPAKRIWLCSSRFDHNIPMNPPEHVRAHNKFPGS